MKVSSARLQFKTVRFDGVLLKILWSSKVWKWYTTGTTCKTRARKEDRQADAARIQLARVQQSVEPRDPHDIGRNNFSERVMVERMGTEAGLKAKDAPTNDSANSVAS